jgi:hypothetical protein
VSGYIGISKSLEKKFVAGLWHAINLLGMGRTFGFVLTLTVVGAGLYLYSRQAQSLSYVGGGPSSAIDAIGVRSDLMAMANAERRYWITNGKYASLGELRRNGDTFIPSRPNYVYSAEVSDNKFRIIATYSGSDPKTQKRVSVDETMALKAD